MSMFSRTKTTSPTDFEQATQAVADITGDYTLDVSHTRLGFSARHAMVTTVRGQFQDYTGHAHIDTANPAASKVELTIQTGSIDTGNPDRNGHLVSPDFFDVENNPEITFVSTEVERHSDSGETTWVITGDLTIKGVTKPVTVDFEYTGTAIDPYQNQRIGFEGKTTVNRKDWGISWNAALDAGGVLVSEKVTLEFEVSAIRTDAS
jgi:polyisoprenoid-binding protein YceI